MSTEANSMEEMADIAVAVAEFGKTIQIGGTDMIADEGDVILALGHGEKAAVLMLSPGEAAKIGFAMLRAAAEGKRQQRAAQKAARREEGN